MTVAAYAPDRADSLYVLPADALALTHTPVPPTALVANLPYNVSVPVLLDAPFARFETIQRVLVMVQLEVAQRLAAGPGSKTYGVPSLKAAWYADVRLVGTVPRSVFWPVPNVDSGLVALTRRPPPPGADAGQTFACITRRVRATAQVVARRSRGGSAVPIGRRQSWKLSVSIPVPAASSWVLRTLRASLPQGGHQRGREWPAMRSCRGCAIRERCGADQ